MLYSSRDALPRRPVLALAGVLALTLVANVAPRLGRFSGDAIIHVLIAERLADGAWFEFNPGEVSSGTTSIAWTIVEASFIRLGGLDLLARAVPMLDLAGLVGAMLLVAYLARTLGSSRAAAALGAIAFGSIPAVAYNSILGMENVVHAAAALAFIAAWSATATKRSPLACVGLGALLGVAALLRPEGILLGAIPLADVVAHRRDRGLARRALSHALIVGAVSLLVIAPLVWKHHAVTGVWVPGSGVSRMMAARRQLTSLHLGPLWVYLGVASRFVIYLPITALALLGAFDAVDALDDRARSARRALLVSIGAGLALYTFVTGAGHIGRLMQALFAFACALVPRGAERAWIRLAASPARRGALLSLAGAMQLALVLAETALRFRDPTQGSRAGYGREWINATYATRGEVTDRTLPLLCASGCCRPGRSPAIGYTEVQLRFAYDARIRAMSFDGRTASRGAGHPPVTFDARGCPSLGSLLDDPDLVAVAESPFGQFPGCPVDPVSAAMVPSGVGAPPSAPTGWRWDARLPGWLRDCAAAAPAPR